MKFKKIFTLLLAFIIFTNSNSVLANDNFVDNNASISVINKNKDAKIVISEYNTGKIISKKSEDEKVEYKDLASSIALFVISEQLRDKNITIDSSIPLVESDSILEEYEINGEIRLSDAIFLLEQKNSSAVLKSIFKKFNITISQAQLILDKLTMRDTNLKSIEISEENTTTAKNINYITSETIKNYPDILEITKYPEYTLKNGKTIENNIKFLESNSIRSLGLDFDGKNSNTITYSGNTKIVVTVLGISEEKDDYFDSLQNLYTYVFNNYEYKLALKAGTYDINNENITINEDIYDLFYKEHSEKDIKYFLMNGKILFFQNYNYLSANSGTVFANYISNSDNSTIAEIKRTFLQDSKFSEKSNKEKLSIVIERTQYFSTFAILIYSIIFIILYFIKKPFDKGE